MTTPLPSPRLDHLRRMTDGRGLFEHASGDLPRTDLGYCTDDAARALVLCCWVGAPADDLRAVFREFTVAAVAPDGRCHNRRDTSGAWTDRPGLGDWWGRAVWALGVAVGAGDDDPQLTEAFERLISRRSRHVRSMAYATLGAAAAADRSASARQLLMDAVRPLADPGQSIPDWPWPEPRLTYDNGLLAAATLAAGGQTERPDLLELGLSRLEFLVAAQTLGDHLSVVPVGGRGPGEPPPGFDQQPVELAGLALAGVIAHRLTGDPRWRQLVGAAAAWFVGQNDLGVAMFDDTTGAGYDGLTPSGRNLNRGAESTLAANLTLLLAHHVGVSACPPPSPTTPTSGYGRTRTG